MDLKIGNEEFSTRLVLNSNLKWSNIGGAKSFKMAQNTDMLRSVAVFSIILVNFKLRINWW